MIKMDFDSVGQELSKRGYKAINLREMESLQGIVANWEVVFEERPVALCHDPGDGGAVRVYWQDQSHKDCLIKIGKTIDTIEPVETALVALSVFRG